MAHYAEIEVDHAQITNVRPDLSATIAGESGCLRTMLHAIIKEMASKTSLTCFTERCLV